MIELSGVRKVYPVKGGNDVIALDDVNLQVENGVIHGIVGQSGAGKSTLIRCLTALERPTEGSITFDGVEMTTLRGRELRDARRRVGMVFQAANLLDSRTAAENIGYPLKLAKTKKETVKKRVADLLDLVGLTGRGSSYPSQLSGGQKQRVGIARALADSPSVLMCDEPTSALDPESTVQILDLLRNVRDRLGVTVLIITHEMRVVREICDSVTLLNHGKIIQSGSLENTLRDISSPLAREIVPAPSIDDADLHPDMDLLDVIFTSEPGKPTGATILNLVASMGADVTAGTFESIGRVQVGRLALSVSAKNAESVIATLRDHDVYAEKRHA